MINQLHQQWFWYRVGTLYQGSEQSIDTISAPVITGLSANTLTTTYYDSANRFNIGITYRLMGGLPSSGTADITEQIAINNTSGGVLGFHFYQYSDFDIAGTPGGDTNIITRSDFTSRINQADQFDGANLIEVVNTPNATHGEADLVPNTLNKLMDSTYTIFDDSRISAIGDVSWGLQWDVTLGIDGSLIISKDKLLRAQFIPEPSGLALLSLGLIGFGLHRRRFVA